MMCPKSRHTLWLRPCLLALGLLLAQVSWGQTTNGVTPPLPVKPPYVSVPSSSLLSLWQKLQDLKSNSDDSLRQATIAQEQAQLAQDKAESLSVQLDQQKQDSTELSKSLAASLTKAALADQATKDREALDQKLLNKAEGEKWLYAGGAAILAVALVKGFEYLSSALKH